MVIKFIIIVILKSVGEKYFIIGIENKCDLIR